MPSQEEFDDLKLRVEETERLIRHLQTQQTATQQNVETAMGVTKDTRDQITAMRQEKPAT